MTPERFATIVAARLDTIRETLISKGREYAPGADDRMINFKLGAQMQGITPVECLRGYMTKHIASIYDLLRNPSAVSAEMWAEKIGDAINYLILLEALLQDTGGSSE